MTLKFNKTYALLTIILLTVEVLIAMYLKSGFIRYTVGDFLVVILLYCFFKSFLNSNAITLAIAVLAVAYLIELSQLFNVLKWFRLENNYLAKLIMGSTFQVSDLVAYSLGMLSFLIIDLKFITHE